MYICGFYYKHVMIVNDDSSIISKWSIKFIDDPSVVIYNRHMLYKPLIEFKVGGEKVYPR